MLTIITLALASCIDYPNEFKQAIGKELTFTPHKSETAVSVKEETLREIKTWFIENSDKWGRSSTTYSPSKDTLRNPNITIYIYQNLMVVNMKKSDGDWVQVSRKIDSNEIGFLEKLRQIRVI